MNAHREQPEYKTILREALVTLERGCSEMISDGNGGWIGIGWFKEQPSHMACLNYCKREKVSAQYCPCNSIFKGEK